jgi:hypothetical protein
LTLCSALDTAELVNLKVKKTSGVFNTADQDLAVLLTPLSKLLKLENVIVFFKDIMKPNPTTGDIYYQRFMVTKSRNLGVPKDKF